MSLLLLLKPAAAPPTGTRSWQGGTPDLQQTFEGGTGAADGVAITTTNVNGPGNSPYTSVTATGGTLTYSSAWVHSGTLSQKNDSTAATTTVQGVRSITTTLGTRWTYTVHFNLAINPTAAWALIATYAGGTQVLHAQSGTNLTFRPGPSGTANVDTGYALRLNTAYRLEVGVVMSATAANSGFDYALFIGDSTTPVASAPFTAYSTLGAAAITEVRFGSGSSGIRQFYIDDWAIALNKPSGYLGPYIVTTTGGGSTGQLKVNVGGTWVAKPVKVNIGGTWVVKPAKIYNGTDWVVTPY